MWHRNLEKKIDQYKFQSTVLINDSFSLRNMFNSFFCLCNDEKQRKCYYIIQRVFFFDDEIEFNTVLRWIAKYLKLMKDWDKLDFIFNELESNETDLINSNYNIPTSFR